MTSFEQLVADAIDQLPPAFAAALDNVVVVVEQEPSASDRRSVGLEPGEDLFGLYSGTPQPSRGAGYTFAQPDRITIYRGPLERAFTDPDHITEQVRRTVLHEIAHHFGIDDNRLDELGWG